MCTTVHLMFKCVIGKCFTFFVDEYSYHIYIGTSFKKILLYVSIAYLYFMVIFVVGLEKIFWVNMLTLFPILCLTSRTTDVSAYSEERCLGPWQWIRSFLLEILKFEPGQNSLFNFHCLVSIHCRRQNAYN